MYAMLYLKRDSPCIRIHISTIKVHTCFELHPTFSSLPLFMLLPITGGGGGGKGAIDTSHFGHGQQILLSSPALLFLRTPCQALMFPPILNRCQCLFLSSFPNAPCFLLSSFYDDGSFFSCSIAVSVFPYPLFFQCSSLPSFLLPLVLCE